MITTTVPVSPGATSGRIWARSAEPRGSRPSPGDEARGSHCGRPDSLLAKDLGEPELELGEAGVVELGDRDLDRLDPLEGPGEADLEDLATQTPARDQLVVAPALVIELEVHAPILVAGWASLQGQVMQAT